MADWRKEAKRLSKRVLAGIFLLAFTVTLGCGQVQQDTAGNSDDGNGKGADTEASALSGEEELTLQFLDVGQGSATLVHQGECWMLIDGGDREYSSYVVSFLKKQGVEKLDYVVVSHYDSDHLSGIVGVLNTMECGQVLAPDYEGDTKTYDSFCQVVEEKEISLVAPQLGDTYEFAKSSFRIVSPASYEYTDDNSNSLGIRLEYQDNSFLICGDCTEESEQDLLYLGVEMKSDVFVANHHGSRYSNSPEFLEAVDPKAVVVSCGKGNSYGHPDATVLLSVQKLGADLYRTDLQGTIMAISDGQEIRFTPEASMDYRSGRELDEGMEESQGPQLELYKEDVLPYYEEDGSAKEAASEEDAPDGKADEAKAVSTEESSGEAYVLNIGTKKFHKKSCSSVEDMKEENKAYVSERAEAIEKGYEPCKRCNP